MASITREQFQTAFQGRSIDLGTLSPELRKDLAAAGIGAAEMRQIAGADGVIQGNDELGKLFKALDNLDHDGSYPFRGAIVVLQHGKQKHVAILAGVDASGKNVYLGGNQDNAVNLSTFPDSEILAIRKPKGYEIPAELKTLPQIAATKATSSR